LRVDALAHQRWRWVLPQVEGTDRTGCARHRVGHGARSGRPAADAFDDGLEVLERGPAATADGVDPEILDELGQRLGQREWLQRIERLAAAQVDRDTRVRD